MKILLIVDNWKKNGKTVSEEYDKLCMGRFHSGTAFGGEINLAPEDEAELRESMEQGYRPVFWVMEGRA